MPWPETMPLASRTLSEPLGGAMARVRDSLAGLSEELPLPGDVLRPFLVEGKLLRARLLLAGAMLGTGEHVPAGAVDAATAIELVHAGGLAHDDVVDHSTVRRGRPTLAHRFGPRAATSAGLFLMLRGAADLGRLGDPCRSALARMARDVARGQTDELAVLHDATVGPAAYLRRAYAKTGALYEFAGRAGATVAGLEPTRVELVGEFAARLGTAFQLVDDVRDLTGSRGLGREPWTDLREGVLTYPVLLALGGTPGERRRLEGLLGRDATATDREACARLLEENGSILATREAARSMLREALDRLSGFSPSTAMREMSALTGAILELAGTGEDPDDPPAAPTASSTGAGPRSSDRSGSRRPPRPLTTTLAAFVARTNHTGRWELPGSRAASPSPSPGSSPVIEGLRLLLLELFRLVILLLDNLGRVPSAEVRLQAPCDPDALAGFETGEPIYPITLEESVGLIDLLAADAFALLAGMPAVTAEGLARDAARLFAVDALAAASGHPLATEQLAATVLTWGRVPGGSSDTTQRPAP